MVFFTAPWCGPCRLSIPVVKEVLQQFKAQIDVVEVCTDDFPEVASGSGVVSIPTIQLYYRGKIQDTIVGCVAANVLASSVGKALEDVGMKNTPPDVES
jgi:thioredoxin 1